MNKFVKFGLAMVALAITLYLVCAFGTWHFNPGRWSEDARVTCSLLFGSAFFVGAVMVFAPEL